MLLHLLAIFPAVAIANPHYGLADFPWKASAEHDSRGPCPVLNTMANHGLIPRSGRNITVENVKFGLSRGVNVAHDISIMATENAVKLNPNKTATSFDLHMLSKHNVVEHDNSLTRADAYFGDNQSFNQTVLDQTLSFLPNQVISLKDAASALAGRMRHSQRTNPEFVLDVFGSTSTTASYIAIMGDAEKGEAVRGWVKYLFEHERLPFELGWKPRSPAYNMDTLMSLSDRVTKLLPKDLQKESLVPVDFHSQQVLEL